MALGPASAPVRAWDSAGGNPTHSTHSYLTEWAVDQLQEEYPELRRFRRALIRGANKELHGEPVTRTRHGVTLDGRRRNHQEANGSSGNPKAWWNDSLAAYRKGDKEAAYFLLGILLHMIQDMGVPAHANGVPHQGNLAGCDNLEFMALWNWKPSFQAINRTDPGFAAPWRYYAFSREWTQEDAPDYRDREQFPKTWVFASTGERTLLRNRQGRTCYTVKWALESAAKAFGPETGATSTSCRGRIFRGAQLPRGLDRIPGTGLQKTAPKELRNRAPAPRFK